jgi:hypothetical protein
MPKCSTKKKEVKARKRIPKQERPAPEEEIYDHIDTSDKDLRREQGLFLFPENIVGKTDHGLRKFLVFYFDDVKDYEKVLATLQKQGSKTRSHPDLDSKKLVRLIGGAK